MKSFRRALLFAFALSTTACGPVPTEAPESTDPLVGEAQAPLSNSCPSTLPAAPTGPTAPTPLSSIPAGTPLYPATSGLRSAHTVIVTDPANSSLFWAFGFDVRSQRVVFWVSGDMRNGDLRRLNIQTSNDIEVIEQTVGYDWGFTWGSSGQVGGPIIPKPGIMPGILESAWRVASNNNFQINDSMMRGSTPLPIYP